MLFIQLSHSLKRVFSQSWTRITLLPQTDQQTRSYPFHPVVGCVQLSVAKRQLRIRAKKVQTKEMKMAKG